MLLEDVYRGSADMQNNLLELMEMTRKTIDGISTASSNKNSNDQKPFDMSRVELGNDVFKAVAQSHTVMDLLINEVEKAVNESTVFLDDFDADVASQLTGSSKSKTNRKKT